MENRDLSNYITANFKAFTKSERKVAKYILEQPRDVVYMSITDLADKCEVGDSTVFRFCRTMKFEGYQDFKMALAQSLSVNPNENNMALSGQVNLDDSLEEMSDKLLNCEISALNYTRNMLKTEDIKKAVEYLGAAKNVRFFGIGSSGLLCFEAKEKFARIMPNVEFVQDAHLQSVSASLMTEKDVAVVVSYSGSTKDTIDILKNLKSHKVRTICITRFLKSPITNYADIVLLCGADESPFQGGSLSAKITQLYLVDLLYTEFFRQNYNYCKKNLEITTEAIASKLL